MKSPPVKFFVRTVNIGLFGLAMFVVPPTLAAAGAAKPDATPDTVVQLAAAHLPEPLIRTSPTKPSEDRALLKAMAAFEQRIEPDDFSSLVGFLAAHPHSAWRVALLTNLGLSYLHYGYYSRALSALSAAWREGKQASGTHSKALVDRAVGELILLHARLGHAMRVEALFEQIGSRPVSGPATATVQLAREALWVMRNDPRHMWLCGPLALKFLMLAEKASPQQVDFLQRYRAGPQGVSLTELARLAEKAGAPYVAVFRNPDQPVPVPSVVHWKAGHYAAILGEKDGLYRVYDPVLGVGVQSVTAGAIKDEASGYFLVGAKKAEVAGWRKVAAQEAGRVWGAGPTNGPPPDFPSGPPANPPPDCGSCPCDGCTSYNIGELGVGVVLTDTPVGYVPPIGPSARLTITYNQWEASQPSVFSFFNISPKWTFNWLTYIQDDPHAVGVSATRYRPNGGDSPEFVSATPNVFLADEVDESVLTVTSQNPIVYTRQLRDGTVETYAQSDGSTSYPRHVFLTAVSDPQGNTLTLNYQIVNNQVRLNALTDATGRQTTFSYGLAGAPLLVTQITDPFGRSGSLTYDGSGRLVSITDVLGLTSRFTYDANSLVNSLATPYGTTTFAYGGSGNGRWVQVTDPLGYNEREETLQPAPVPFSEPSNTIPQGIVNPFNQYLDYRDSFHWDKHAYVIAGCTLTGNLPSTCNYNDARETHFAHYANNINITWEPTESRKYPLENRIWLNLPGQNSNPNCTIGTACSGTYDQPSAIGRVLDDGSSQLTSIAYNGAGNITKYVDPAGRTTAFLYAPNMIDLMQADQLTTQAAFATIASYTYNQQHRPLTYTDAAMQVTQYSYNSAGQVTQMILPLGRVWSFAYDALGRLVSVVNPNGAAAISYTYDGFDRIATATDSEGYVLRYTYDAADRITQITYPDGTTRTYTYQNLDLAAATDRQGHTARYGYDANRNLVSVMNPLGGLTQYAYFENGVPKSLTDPNGNTTSSTIDVQGRLTQKRYADGTQQNFAYEATTSRLHSVTDALGQTKQYSYTIDNRLASISYPNAAHPTPTVNFDYDRYFPRLTDSYQQIAGGTSYGYSYVRIGSPGALKLQQEVSGTPTATIDYQYDAAGRLVARTIVNPLPGPNSQETFGYDALDRLISHGNPLGQFSISYLGQTPQMTSRQLTTNAQVNSAGRRETSEQQSATGAQVNWHLPISGGRRVTGGQPPAAGGQVTWSYLPNSGDRQLATITNYSFRQYQYTTTPESLISAINEQSSSNASVNWNFLYDAANRLTSATSSTGLQYGIALDAAGNITSVGLAGSTVAWAYNNLNQLVSGSTGNYTYDADGNRLTDNAARSYTWDAENRLAGITGSANTQYSYDPFGRRTGIAMTGQVATQFLWCGSHICQSSTPNGVQRQYYDEGEFIPASATMLYYGRDQLGSVRDVAVLNQQGTAVQAYDFDPFGNTLSAPASGTMPDFRYAGMYYDAGSGLYLTHYRAYDPSTAHWLTRDPIGEMTEAGPQKVSPRAPRLAPMPLAALAPVDTFTPIRIALPGGAVSPPALAALVTHTPPESNLSNLYLYVSADPMNLMDPSGLGSSPSPSVPMAPGAFGAGDANVGFSTTGGAAAGIVIACLIAPEITIPVVLWGAGIGGAAGFVGGGGLPHFTPFTSYSDDP